MNLANPVSPLQNKARGNRCSRPVKATFLSNPLLFFKRRRLVAMVVALIGCVLSFGSVASAVGPDGALHVASRGAISVLAQGAVGDGKADDTQFFQQALDAAGAQGGGIVEAPAGRYRIAGTLRIPANVTLRGTFASAPTGSSDMIEKGGLGSVLLAYAGRGKPESAAFITLAGVNAALDGFAISYPEWDPKIVPPIPYPPTVATPGSGQVHIDSVAVLNCLFLNSYEAIHLAGAGRHHIRNVTGYPIWRGIYVDQVYDVGRIEDVHFWPFGHKYSTDDPYSQWINREGVAIEIAFSDWQIISNSFSFGYGVGFKFSKSPITNRGGCGKLIGCGVDCSSMPLQFLANYSHWLISEGEFVGRWASGGCTAVDIGPDVAGKVSFSNCAFWGPLSRVVSMRAPKGTVSLDNCQISNWEDNVGAIDIESGRAILQGNSFNQEGNHHVIVGKGAGPVVATGNLAYPAFDIRAAAGVQVLSSANQEETLAWTDEAKGHYIITVGSKGDSRYLDNWNAQESGKAEPLITPSRRWSRGESFIRLPVKRGVAYAIVLQASVPGKAISKESGIYLGETRLAEIASEGDQIIRLVVPPQTADTVNLRVVVQEWMHSSAKEKLGRDMRQLGISLRSIEATAVGAHAGRTFDAGAGEWMH
jgi:hypothetical protein